MDKKAQNMRHLSRQELVEIILEQKKQELALKEQLAEAEKKLEDRRIQIAEAGSIAEAAMKLSGVFAAAQEAADLYVESVIQAQEEAEMILNAAREEGERILKKAQQEADDIRRKNSPEE